VKNNFLTLIFRDKIHTEVPRTKVISLVHCCSNYYQWQFICGGQVSGLRRKHSESLEHQKLVPVVAVDTFLMSVDLHRPLETLATDITTMRFDREMLAADVVTQGRGIFELRGADMTHAGFSAVEH